VTGEQAAQLAGVSRRTISKWLRRGLLTHPLTPDKVLAVKRPTKPRHGADAAAMIGVSRKTVYRWMDEGRLAYPLSRADIEARMPTKRPRGPRRNPQSRRYTVGRRTFRPREDSAI
jgi:predicted site-specific integrase-resolvase